MDQRRFVVELSYERADARVRAIGGTSAHQLGTFVSWLVRQQHSVGYVCIVARHAAAFGPWCERRGVGLDSLTDDDIARYQRNRDRRRSRRADTRRQERQELNLLMRFLREAGICTVAPLLATPGDGVADDFARHLQCDQGIAPITVEPSNLQQRRLQRVLVARVDTGFVERGDEPSTLIFRVAPKLL
jgi:integrase/recombinase XerD